jgi:hypothetical protein
MKRIFLIIFCFADLLASAQETHVSDLPPTIEYISLTTDLAQYVFNQPNVGLAFRKNSYELGMNFGLIQPTELFAVNILADGQYKWPGTVYSGDILRPYVKYFACSSHHISYWGAQITLEYEWFNNVTFYDYPEGGDYPQFDYTMNEKTFVWGISIFHGHEWKVFKVFNIDLFYGLGFYDKIRNFTVTYSTNPYYGSYLAEGAYKGSLSYCTPIVGLKLGFCYPINKKSN